VDEAGIWIPAFAGMADKQLLTVNPQLCYFVLVWQDTELP
jgi:hypothetical protein